jgi:hypothetical protein
MIQTLGLASFLTVGASYRAAGSTLSQLLKAAGAREARVAATRVTGAGPAERGCRAGSRGARVADRLGGQEKDGSQLGSVRQWNGCGEARCSGRPQRPHWTRGARNQSWSRSSSWLGCLAGQCGLSWQEAAFTATGRYLPRCCSGNGRSRMHLPPTRCKVDAVHVANHGGHLESGRLPPKAPVPLVHVQVRAPPRGLAGRQAGVAPPACALQTLRALCAGCGVASGRAAGRAGPPRAVGVGVGVGAALTFPSLRIWAMLPASDGFSATMKTDKLMVPG